MAPRIPAHRFFFPLGAAYAALALPASVAAMTGAAGAPGLSFPVGHAHEMLFGFALAAVAGNQLGPTTVPTLATLLAAWTAARLSFVLVPHTALAALANAAFPALLAWQLAPRLFGRAKKWRNMALPVVLAALCLAAVAIQWPLHFRAGEMPREVLRVGVLLIALLMLFMGGRIIAPAAAGQIYRQGGDLEARVQPGLEGAMIVTMLLASVNAALGATGIAGVLVVAAGVAAILRMLRWRLWSLRGRPDLLCLAAGYAWLAAGLLAVGAAMIAQRPASAALHLITVGAIGTLTINVMALTAARLARLDPARARLPVWATGLIALATLSRVLADGAEARTAMLWAAAALWAAAYALLLANLALVSRARRGG